MERVAVREPTTQRATPERVIRDPQILGGEPVVRGTRIAVRNIILASREYGGLDGVLKAYPWLSREDAQAALAFYEAHKVEIDEQIKAELAAD